MGDNDVPELWTIKQVLLWLDGLDLNLSVSVKEKFMEHKIDGPSLLCLSEEHMKEMGFEISSRLQLLQEIQNLDQQISPSYSPIEQRRKIVSRDKSLLREQRKIISTEIEKPAVNILSDQ